MKLNYLRQIYDKYSVSNVMKIRPVGAELSLADGRAVGQTDRHDEANCHFSQFCARA